MKPPSDEWTVATLKELLDRELRNRDEALKLARSEIDRRLNGMNELRDQINSERGLFITQTQHDALIKDFNGHFQRVDESLAEGRGRQAAYGVATAVIATLLAVVLGFSLSTRLSTADVSSQIAHESPWANDRPGIESRLSALQAQAGLDRQRINSIESLDRFFCRTRAPRLPGC